MKHKRDPGWEGCQTLPIMITKLQNRAIRVIHSTCEMLITLGTDMKFPVAFGCNIFLFFFYTSEINVVFFFYVSVHVIYDLSLFSMNLIL